jgi:hypothetical protein
VDRKRGFVIYNGTGEDDQSFDAKYSGAYNKKVRDANSALLQKAEAEPPRVHVSGKVHRPQLRQGKEQGWKDEKSDKVQTENPRHIK